MTLGLYALNALDRRWTLSVADRWEAVLFAGEHVGSITAATAFAGYGVQSALCHGNGKEGMRC
jgi:hypothetical protein